jgi:hypothetical protein
MQKSLPFWQSLSPRPLRLRATLEDSTGAATSASEATALDPTRDAAWELLLSMKVDSASPEELVSLCKLRLKSFDSPRNHLLLAKAFLRQKNADRADEQAHAILRIETNNIAAFLVLAVDDLRRSDNPEFLAAAESDLRSAKEALDATQGGEPSYDRWREITLNLAIWNALQGTPECLAGAKECVQAVLEHIPDDETAKAILRATQ